MEYFWYILASERCAVDQNFNSSAATSPTTMTAGG